jgi:hypothetical protein
MASSFMAVRVPASAAYTDATWRCMCIATALIAQHGGYKVSFTATGRDVEVAVDSVALRVSRAGGVSATVPANDAFRRLAVAAATILTGASFYQVEAEEKAGPINGYWLPVWRAASMWVAAVLPHVFMPPMPTVSDIPSLCRG